VSFRVGEWVPTVGAFVRIVVLGFSAISVVIYAIVNGIHDTFGAAKFAPSHAIFTAAVPVLFFSYVGFELPSAAGRAARARPVLGQVRHSDRGQPVVRPYKLPGGTAGFWVAGALCTFWAIFASLVVIYPGLGTNWLGRHGNPKLGAAIRLHSRAVRAVAGYLAGGLPGRRHSALHRGHEDQAACRAGADHAGDGPGIGRVMP
jgi:hypothetical protein